MAVVGVGEAGRRTGRLDEPIRPLVGRGVVRPGHPSVCVADRHTGRPDRPQGVSADRRLSADRVVRRAVRAGPVRSIRGPIAGRRGQVGGVRHRVRVPGRGRPGRRARPTERRGGRARLAGHAHRHNGRPVRAVHDHERVVGGREHRVPGGRVPRAGDAATPVGRGPRGRRAPRSALVPRGTGTVHRAPATPDGTRAPGAGHLARAVRRRREPGRASPGGRRVPGAAGRRHRVRARLFDHHAAGGWARAAGTRGRGGRGRPVGVIRAGRAAHRSVWPAAAADRIARLSGRDRRGVRGVPDARGRGRPPHRLGAVRVRRAVRRRVLRGRGRRARRAPR